MPPDETVPTPPVESSTTPTPTQPVPSSPSPPPDTTSVVERQAEAEGSIENLVEPDYGDMVEKHFEPQPEEVTPGDDPSQPPKPEEVKPAPPPVPEEKAPEPAAPQQPAAATQPAVPVPVPVVPAQPAPVVSSETPEQIETKRAELEAAIMVELTKRYSLDPAEAVKLDELDSKPSEYLPKILAKAHKEISQSVLAAVIALLPQAITGLNERTQVVVKAEEKFFTRWPELKAHAELTEKTIRAYKQVDPSADMDTVIERAGAMAMVQAGLSPAPGQPAAPAKPNGGTPPPVMQPHTPIGPGINVGAPGSNRFATYEEEVFSKMVDENRNFAREG